MIREGKGRIVTEMIGTLSHDPLSVRFVRPWVRSLRAGNSPIAEALPWMNFKVIRWLDAYLRRDMLAFEFGTGGSTLFVARRTRWLVSIEHDPRWHEAVSRAVAGAGLTNCTLRFIPPEPAPGVDALPYGPASYRSLSPEVAGMSFERYARSIDEHPDASLDLVIVDGYARPSCIRHAIPKVRPGGALLVDDTDWRKYRHAYELLRPYPHTDFVGVTPFQRNLRQTTVWRL